MCNSSIIKSFAGRFMLTTFLVVSILLSSIVAQNKYWREMKGKPLTKFDWNCALTSSYPKAKLRRVVKTAMKQERTAGNSNADRAFPFDLNNDGKPEYFVPLDCGATGNCNWGVFALKPARFLGTVNGQYIYIYPISFLLIYSPIGQYYSLLFPAP